MQGTEHRQEEETERFESKTRKVAMKTSNLRRPETESEENIKGVE